MNLRLTLALLAGTSLATPALAQDAPEEPTPQDEAQDTPAAADAIVVTGSRIIRNGNSSPTPVTVVSNEELMTASPANIPAALNKLPSFSGVNGQNIAFGPAESNLAGNFLNLRDFGSERTLILMDGKRVPPTTSEGLVDVNLMPQMLVSRVEVVTGGASAAYGSDAITGVVNFILDDRFDGIKLQASSGISQRGDFRQIRLGAAAGTSFADGRGHIVASAEYFDNPGLLSTDARENTRRVWFNTGAGTEDNPYVLTPDVRWAGFTSPNANILAVLGPDLQGLGGQVFLPGGDVRPFIHGEATGTPGYESGGDGFYFRKSSVVASLETKQTFAKATFEVTPGIELYAQGSYSEARNLGTSFPFTYFPFYVAPDNAFLSQNVRDALAAEGAGGLIVAKSSEDWVGTQTQAKSRNYSIMAGIAGSLGDTFDFDVSYTRANSRQFVTNLDNISTTKLAAALDAVDNGGEIVCRVTLTNPGLYDDCVPIDPFGRGSESIAAHDYVTDDTNYRLTNTLDNVAATISGSPFETWAGPVGVALSGEYRNATLRNVSTNSPFDAPDCTGLNPINCGAPPFFTQQYIFSIVNDVPKVSQAVWEGAVEVEIPLIADAAFAQSFSVNGAFRYADYETVGGAETWKLGVNWEVFDGLTLRATRSRDFRAPTLINLFAPGNRSISGFSDLLTGTNPTVIANNTSNPNLRPEVSDALVIGAVFQPDFAPGFSLAVDYFKFELDDLISSVTPVDPTIQQECYDSDGASELCDLIVRDPDTGLVTEYFVRPLNRGTRKTEGVDVELNYRTALGAGDLSLRALGTYQPTFTSNGRNVAGAVDGLYNGSLQLPKYRFTGFVRYDIDNFSIDLVQRWRSSVKRTADPDLVFADPKVDSIGYTDVTVTFSPEDANEFDFFLSVQNLFDAEAPLYRPPNESLPGWGGPPILYRDDEIGRYFTVGARAKF